MKRRTKRNYKEWVRAHWKRLLLYTGGGVLAVLVAVQLAYPSSRLVPFVQIDGQTFSGWTKEDAATQLDTMYAKRTIGVYFGDRSEAYRTPTPQAIGLKVHTADRVHAISYAWWLRLVPTSLWWAHMITDTGAATYQRNDKTLASYIEKELGESCDVAPKNATIQAKDTKLIVVPSEAGGTCEVNDVRKHLSTVSPSLTEDNKVRIPMKVIPSAVGDDQAKVLAEAIAGRVGAGVQVQAGEQPVQLATKDIYSWLDFPVVEDQLTVRVNGERAAKVLEEQVGVKVARAAGVSKVTTMDFVETARVNGASGQALDVSETVAVLTQFVGGQMSEVVARTRVVPPRVEYTRNYSPTDTGLSALLKQFSEGQPGSFGVSLIELSGDRRRAAFEDTKQFRTASTYKLFVAYSTLKRVEAGTWHWHDQVTGGRNLERCFGDMIVKSDNPCSEVLLEKIGYRTITNEMKALGLTRTTFLEDVPKTTAGDLVTFLAALESGQLLSSDSSSRLIGAMKRNVFRQGIPAGASGQVADKVGFLNALLHDAAIIYGPNGPAVLVIMSDNSSWGVMAEFTRKIEALRAQ